MDSRVLITYATRMGSTEEVIRAVAQVFRENGAEVEILPAREVRSVATYTAVVLGAPLYMGRMLKDARRFLNTHRDELIKLPVAIIVPGPVQKEEKDWIGARQQLDKELKKFPWLSPVAAHIVGGRFDPARLGFPFKLIPAMKRIPLSDVRDWTMIRSLASELTTVLQPALHR